MTLNPVHSRDGWGWLIEGGRVVGITNSRKKRRKPPFGGVFTGRSLATWLIRRPRDLLDVFPQLVDKVTLARPVSDRDDVRRAVADLDRDGVAIMERVATPELIEQARRDLDGFVERIPELEGATRTKLHSSGRPVDYSVHEWDPLESTCRHASLSIL